MRTALISIAIAGCAEHGSEMLDAVVPFPDATRDASIGHDAASGPDTGAAFADASADAGIDRDTGVEPDAGALTDMQLEASGGSLVRGGVPIPFRGAISCCGGGYGWPVVDEAWIDYVASKDVTFLHVRLGPFLTGSGGEPDWARYGGGYAEGGELADLDRFNEPFWARVRSMIERARSRGIWVEVDVADGWAIRHCRRADIPEYSAWSASNNLQSEDACGSAGSASIAPGSVHDRWVRKVALETGRFDNVVYQDGNEIGLLGDYDAAWTISMQAIIREEEQSHGYVRHLFGTNSDRNEAIGAAEVDFVELHGDAAADPSQCAAKPCLVNEYNPDPPLSPEEIHDRYCAALGLGTYFWYWRHGQDEAAMDASLSMIAAGCP